VAERRGKKRAFSSNGPREMDWKRLSGDTRKGRKQSNIMRYYAVMCTDDAMTLAI